MWMLGFKYRGSLTRGLVLLYGVNFIKALMLALFVGLKMPKKLFWHLDTTFLQQILSKILTTLAFWSPTFICQICILKLNIENAIIFWRYVRKFLGKGFYQIEH